MKTKTFTLTTAPTTGSSVTKDLRNSLYTVRTGEEVNVSYKDITYSATVTDIKGDTATFTLNH